MKKASGFKMKNPSIAKLAKAAGSPMKADIKFDIVSKRQDPTKIGTKKQLTKPKRLSFDRPEDVDYMYKKLSILSDQIKIATVYYKPTKNETIIKPHFYIQERDEWVVFPHELMGLTDEEVSFKNRLIS